MTKGDYHLPGPDGRRGVESRLKRQLADENCFVRRDHPATARPYPEDFHAAAFGAAE